MKISKISKQALGLLVCGILFSGCGGEGGSSSSSSDDGGGSTTLATIAELESVIAENYNGMAGDEVSIAVDVTVPDGSSIFTIVGWAFCFPTDPHAAPMTPAEGETVYGCVNTITVTVEGTQATVVASAPDIFIDTSVDYDILFLGFPYAGTFDGYLHVVNSNLTVVANLQDGVNGGLEFVDIVSADLTYESAATGYSGADMTELLLIGEMEKGGAIDIMISIASSEAGGLFTAMIPSLPEFLP